jgi:hypothetical protein
MSAPRPGVHKSLSEQQQEAPDLGRMIESFGCTQQFDALEECMGEHDRSWAKCREQVKELQRCNAKEHPDKATQQQQK